MQKEHENFEVRMKNIQQVELSASFVVINLVYLECDQRII